MAAVKTPIKYSFLKKGTSSYEAAMSSSHETDRRHTVYVPLFKNTASPKVDRTDLLPTSDNTGIVVRDFRDDCAPAPTRTFMLSEQTAGDKLFSQHYKEKRMERQPPAVLPPALPEPVLQPEEPPVLRRLAPPDDIRYSTAAGGFFTNGSSDYIGHNALDSQVPYEPSSPTNTVLEESDDEVISAVREQDPEHVLSPAPFRGGGSTRGGKVSGTRGGKVSGTRGGKVSGTRGKVAAKSPKRSMRRVERLERSWATDYMGRLGADHSSKNWKFILKRLESSDGTLLESMEVEFGDNTTFFLKQNGVGKANTFLKLPDADYLTYLILNPVNNAIYRTKDVSIMLKNGKRFRFPEDHPNPYIELVTNKEDGCNLHYAFGAVDDEYNNDQEIWFHVELDNGADSIEDDVVCIAKDEKYIDISSDLSKCAMCRGPPPGCVVGTFGIIKLSGSWDLKVCNPCTMKHTDTGRKKGKETKAETKAEVKAETKAETKAEVKAETKMELKRKAFKPPLKPSVKAAVQRKAKRKATCEATCEATEKKSKGLKIISSTKVLDAFFDVESDSDSDGDTESVVSDVEGLPFSDEEEDDEPYDMRRLASDHRSISEKIEDDDLNLAQLDCDVSQCRKGIDPATKERLDELQERLEYTLRKIISTRNLAKKIWFAQQEHK